MARHGKAMLISPDPLKQPDEFKAHVNTTVCYCGIHSHDSHRSGTCHKSPKGIDGCRLTRPLDTMECTKPVELIDTTTIEKQKQDKLSYTIRERICSREPKDRLFPLNDNKTDPRLVVWEI